MKGARCGRGLGMDITPDGPGTGTLRRRNRIRTDHDERSEHGPVSSAPPGNETA
jgi:hypothetical protein